MHKSKLISKLQSLPRTGRGIMDDVNAMKNAFTALDNAQGNLVVGTQILVNEQLKLLKGFEDIAAPMLQLEMRNAALQKTFGLSIKQSSEMGKQLDLMAESFGTGGRHMRKYAMSLKGIIGNFTTAKTIITSTGKSMLFTQRMIQANLGLTEKAAQEFEFYSSTIAENSSDQLVQTSAIAKEIEGITGQQGLFKEIVKDIGNLTADLQIQFGRIPGQLELGLVKAKALGLTMADMNASGKNLLNIESSIGQELEYQLLSGKRLVDQDGKSLTNKFRIATLQGKASDQADVLNDILEQEGDTLKNNLFARQQMSQLLGMDEAKLSRALQKKSILEDLPGGDALFDKTGDELIEAAEAMGATEEQLKELQETEDTRQTPDILSDIKDLMTTNGIKTLPVGTQQDLSKGIIDGMKGLQVAMGDGSPLGKVATMGIGALKQTRAITKATGEAFTSFKEVFSKTFTKIDSLTGVIATTDRAVGVSTTGEVTVNEAEEDFIYSAGTITPFNPGDQFIAGKSGGPMIDALNQMLAKMQQAIVTGNTTNVTAENIANAFYDVLDKKGTIKIVTPPDAVKNAFNT